MKNWGKRKTITNLFWKIFPFVVTTCVLIPALMYKTKAPTYWFIFLPAVVLCLFPFSVGASFFIREIVIAKRIQPNCFKVVSRSERNRIREELLQNPKYAELARKASKWGQISILIWIVVFLIIATIAIHFIRIERREDKWQIVKYPQPEVLSEGSDKHELFCTLDTSIRCLQPIPLIALVSFAVFLAKSLLRKWRKRRKETNIFWKILPFVSAALFAIPILLMFALGGLMEKAVRDEVKIFLNNVSHNVTVKIDGQRVEVPKQITSELAKVAPLTAHGTHPTNRIRIEITDSNNGLVVELGRDSSIDQEYWVFYLGYGHTFVNEIGRITTSLFYDY